MVVGQWVFLPHKKPSETSLWRLKQSLFLREALCFEAKYQKGSTSCSFFFDCKAQPNYAHDKASNFHCVPGRALNALQSRREMHTNASWEVPVFITQHSCLFHRQSGLCNSSQFAWFTKKTQQQQQKNKNRNKIKQSEWSKFRKKLLFEVIACPGAIISHLLGFCKDIIFSSVTLFFWRRFQLDVSHCWWLLLLFQGQQKS